MHLILFDIDGTLLWSDGAARRSFEGALVEVFGTPGDRSVRYDGKTDRQIARETMRPAGFDDAEIDARIPAVIDGYLARLRVEVAEDRGHFARLPGVLELLTALEARDDVVLGLLTGNVAAGARVKLEAADVGFDRFRVGAFGCDAEHRPELPAIAQRRASAMLGHAFDGADLVIVGDTPADVQCARGVGARTLAVATGRYTTDALAEHAPTHLFADLTDTDAVVAALVAR